MPGGSEDRGGGCSVWGYLARWCSKQKWPIHMLNHRQWHALVMLFQSIVTDWKTYRNYKETVTGSYLKKIDTAGEIDMLPPMGVLLQVQVNIVGQIAWFSFHHLALNELVTCGDYQTRIWICMHGNSSQNDPAIWIKDAPNWGIGLLLATGLSD